MAPKPDTTHPIKLILPYVDSVAGNINIAEAIMLPITNEVLVQMPIFFGEAIVQATKLNGQMQIYHDIIDGNVDTMKFVTHRARAIAYWLHLSYVVKKTNNSVCDLG